MRDVIVLHATRAGQVDPAGGRALLERLPYAYRLELERRDPCSRAASLQALALLAQGVARLRAAPLEAPRVRISGEGKPWLEGGPHFSISHSQGRVAVALGETCELGLDLEDLGTHGLERAALERWTAIEATLKAVGAGLRSSADVRLAADLASAEIAGALLHLSGVPLAAGCVATLATRAAVGRVAVEECSPVPRLVGR